MTGAEPMTEAELADLDREIAYKRWQAGNYRRISAQWAASAVRADAAADQLALRRTIPPTDHTPSKEAT